MTKDWGNEYVNTAILIINANMAAAQTIKHNLTSPNAEIVCVSSMHDALQTFIRTEICLIILDAGTEKGRRQENGYGFLS